MQMVSAELFDSEYVMSVEVPHVLARQNTKFSPEFFEALVTLDPNAEEGEIRKTRIDELSVGMIIQHNNDLWRIMNGRFSTRPREETGAAVPFVAGSPIEVHHRVGEVLDSHPTLLDTFLALLYVPDPMSAIAGVRKLPPATTLVWEDGRVRAERYWTLVSEMEVPNLEAFEKFMSGAGQKESDMKEFETIMKGYHDLVDHGRREIYKIEA